jgi:hypothetical protein
LFFDLSGLYSPSSEKNTREERELEKKGDVEFYLWGRRSTRESIITNLS